MADLIEQAKRGIDQLIRAAAPALAQTAGSVSIPKNTQNGDFAANHAMAGAKAAGMAPRKLAEEILSGLSLEGTWYTGAETAGPGFLNFRLGDGWYSDVLDTVASEGTAYGRADERNGKRVMVEFVSANPTGPMTIGNARGGVLGDTMASVLDWAGWDVWREFYVNNAGHQVELFGRSVEARYLQIIQGEDAVEFPDNGYHGDDIRAMAQEIYDTEGDKYLYMPAEERQKAFIDYGIPKNIQRMRDDLERYGIKFDRWFLETELHDSGYVAETIDILTQAGHTYERDGQLWLRNTDFGADKDECMRRADGTWTYYAVDIAYHRNKFVERGFDRVIDVWGADHHGHAIRFGSTMTCPELGLNGRSLDFLIMQMVRLTRNGETVKVSRRTGKALTLADLMDEIGRDPCRYFFNASPGSHLEFDLDLAVRQDSENPVYYVQYAHARIQSLLSMLAADGYKPAEKADASLLTAPQERELIKALASFPGEIRQAAQELDPSRINKYATEVASRFHKFYNACRIRGEEENLVRARLLLTADTGIVLENALSILGVTAPDSM
ncbi:MAG: arginine--tRNA ligase [Oscillospiraceae bacterium]|nr:arginine--tRNA ligase [Oscillospiraceae bacterium]